MNQNRSKLEQAKYLTPQVKVFALLYLVYAVAEFLTFQISGHRLHMALVWNLFLAFLPLLFSSLAIRQKQKKWLTVVSLILWLLFFPNAIYVITDVIHLGELTFYGGHFYEVSRVVYTHDIAIWCELITTMAGAFLALIMGMSSLLNVHKFLAKHVGKTKIWFVIGGVSLISSVAIFIGRFLRFNSWDVITQPWRVVIGLFERFDIFAAEFILLMAGFTVFIYVIFYQLLRVYNAKK